MSLRKVSFVVVICLSTFTNLCNMAQGEDRDLFVDQVLRVFAEGGDHINELRDMRGKNVLYPEIVAALTDYVIFDHGTLLDLLFEEKGRAIIAELEKKVRTDIECLPKYISICQPNLAERNGVILSALWYYEEETRR